MHQKSDSIRRASSNEVHFISSSGAPGIDKNPHVGFLKNGRGFTKQKREQTQHVGEIGSEMWNRVLIKA